jgi:hypothetical protein
MLRGIARPLAIAAICFRINPSRVKSTLQRHSLFLQMGGERLQYQKGLTILRSAQCPYSVKNVDAIMETARKMKISANLVELKEASAVQEAPCAFGTFCIIKDGKVLIIRRHDPRLSYLTTVVVNIFIVAEGNITGNILLAW